MKQQDLSTSYIVYVLILALVFLFITSLVSGQIEILVNENLFAKLIAKYFLENPFFIISFIIFSSYRLTRLVVYDSLSTPFRNALKNKLDSSDSKSASHGFLALINKLVTCPWCFGVWATLITIALPIFLGVFGWVLVFIFAISGISSVLVILTNLIGWSAELKKIKVKNKSN